MRTTIRLDDQLLVEVKKLAQERGQTMTAVIEDALRQLLARRKAQPKREKVKLLTVTGEGLQPGVDLDDSASLLDLMENHRDFA